MKCFRCGLEQESANCCRTGKNRYLFNWIGNGWNETNANTKDEAYKKVLIRSKGKPYQPKKGSFRMFTLEEYDKLTSETFTD